MNSCLNSIISVLFCSVTYTNSLLFMTLFYSLSHGFQLVRSRFKSNLLKIQCLNKITAVCIRTCQYLLWVLQQLHCNSASFNLNTNYCSACYNSCFYLTVLNTSKKKCNLNDTQSWRTQITHTNSSHESSCVWWSVWGWLLTLTSAINMMQYVCNILTDRDVWFTADSFMVSFSQLQTAGYLDQDICFTSMKQQSDNKKIHAIKTFTL